MPLFLHHGIRGWLMSPQKPYIWNYTSNRKLKYIKIFDKQNNFKSSKIQVWVDQVRILFVCLFVWGLSSHSRTFHSYGDVIITGEGLQILTYAQHSWPLSSESSLACHTYCDTGHPFIRTSCKNCMANSAKGIGHEELNLIKIMNRFQSHYIHYTKKMRPLPSPNPR